MTVGYLWSHGEWWYQDWRSNICGLKRFLGHIWDWFGLRDGYPKCCRAHATLQEFCKVSLQLLLRRYSSEYDM